MTEVARSVSFEGADARPISARLHVPAGRPRAWAILAHCIPEAGGGAAARIADAMAGRGLGVLRVDCSALERAGGADPSSGASDLVASAEYLASVHNPPQIVVGHGFAGAAALAASGRMRGARAIATLGAPSGAADVLRALPAAREALLFCHSPADERVDIDSARALFEASPHPKSFVSLDGADHRLTNPADADYAGVVVAAWASRYVEAEAEAAAEEEVENQVIVRGGPAGLAQDIRAGHHRLRADEPPSVGGSGTGPGPYDLLLAALGSCSAMTVRLYADRKGWPVDAVTITLDHERRHADDCRNCEESGGRKLDHIDKGIAIEGDLSDEQRERLVEISDKCPVHRTLLSEIRITTTPRS